MYVPLIDILRFIAAVGVMFFHYFHGNLQGHSGPLALFVNYGFLGVQLFFIISGFVIYYSLRKPLKEYALSRFLRLYPLFWVICTLTYIMTRIFPGGQPVSLVVFFENLFIVNNGNVSKMVDGSYWTLTMEILFYFYIGIFVWWFGLKKVEWFYILWFLVSALSFYFGIYTWFIFKVSLARYAPYFIFGGCLGLITERWNASTVFTRARYLALALCSALLPIYISYVLKLSTKPVTDFFGMYDRPGLLIAESFFILVPLAVYLSRFWTKKTLVLAAKIAGGVTYPLYLIHQKIGQMLIGPHRYGYFTAWSVVTVLVMVLASYVFYIYDFKLRKRVLAWVARKWKIYA